MTPSELDEIKARRKASIDQPAVSSQGLVAALVAQEHAVSDLTALITALEQAWARIKELEGEAADSEAEPHYRFMCECPKIEAELSAARKVVEYIRSHLLVCDNSGSCMPEVLVEYDAVVAASGEKK